MLKLLTLGRTTALRTSSLIRTRHVYRHIASTVKCLSWPDTFSAEHIAKLSRHDLKSLPSLPYEDNQEEWDKLGLTTVELIRTVKAVEAERTGECV